MVDNLFFITIFCACYSFSAMQMLHIVNKAITFFLINRRLIRWWASLMKESICVIDNEIYPLTSKVTQLSIAFHHTSCLHKISPDPMSCIVCEALICGYTALTLLLYLLECHGFWPLKPSPKKYFPMIRPHQWEGTLGNQVQSTSQSFPALGQSFLSTVIADR